jgi:branched-chain amino acid transport system ATP-binding protein
MHRLALRIDQKEILSEVSLDIYAGERVALIGPNGAGKSSLLNLVSGGLRPSAGAILLHGKPIAGQPPYKIQRMGLGRSFQSSNVFGRLSVFDNLVCSVLWSLGYRYKLFGFLSGLTDANALATSLMRKIELEHKHSQLAMSLTYSEQRALELGMVLGSGASVLLLDEPTSGMSLGEARKCVDLIKSVTQGKTLLLVEHDMAVVLELADRIAVLDRGKVIAYDTPDKVRHSPIVQQAFRSPLVQLQAGAQ